ncbi:MAG: hypothetical protein JWQ86_6338 [Mycobacterium sp.]|nr:hypothetical protein [Mycobacterium sp.]
MIRCLAAVVGSSAVSLAGIVSPATAAAAPPSDQPSCVYTLSRPQVVSVSGSAMVTATLRPYPCTGEINPNSLTVCVNPQGSSSPGNCGFSAVPSVAQVFVPYKPGTTYVTSGTGCGSVYTTQGSICSTLGPVSTTL